jgi:hypothetical protein
MARPTDTPILPQPADPAPLWQCPHCLAVFVLRLVRIARPKVGEMRVYHCGKCGKETEYLAGLPDHVV